MKIIERKIGEYFYKKVIKPIRSKEDAILLLLEALKLVKDSNPNVQNAKGKLVVYIDKMSRIFFETERNTFSFCFPFSVEEMEDGSYRIYDSVTDLEVTNQMISLLISILEKSKNEKNSLDNVIDYIIESSEDYEYKNINHIWRLLLKLWNMEEGYIRYDCDLEHENGDRHPLNHLDINYSSSVTYKLGLKDRIALDTLKDILDITTDCSYVSVNN